MKRMTHRGDGMGRTRGALALGAVAVVLLVAGPARAFRVEGPIPPNQNIATARLLPNSMPPFVHWDLREFPDCRVPYSFDLGTADLPGASEFVYVYDAFYEWNAVNCALVQFYEKALPLGGTCPLELDNKNLIGWTGAVACAGPGDDVWLVGGAPACGVNVGANVAIIGPGADGWLTSVPNNCPGGGDDTYAGATITSGPNGIIESAPNQLPNGVLALTGVFYNVNSGNLLEADILFNDNFNWTVVGHGAPMGGNPDVWSIAMHEIGHFFGLHHPTLAGLANPPGPIMEPFFNLAGNANHILAADDMDGINFLYCPDLGDAPDPWKKTRGEYPSLVHGGPGRLLNGERLLSPATGAEHLFGIKPVQPARNFTYEWLAKPTGGDVDAECEAKIVDRDAFDDGVSIIPNPPVWGKPIIVIDWVTYANDALGNGHNYAANAMYANTWLDLNQDGVWAPAEKFIHAPLAPANPVGANATGNTLAVGVIPLPECSPKQPDEPMWLRTRLDWAEDVGAAGNIDGSLAQPAGAAQFGEVEDYPIKCLNPWYQLIVPNLTTTTNTGVTWVVPMNVTSGVHFGAFVDPGDCPIGTLGPPPTPSYQSTSDETYLRFPVPTTVPPGRTIHTGWCQPDGPTLGMLRAFWDDGLAPPTQGDLIPIVNSSAWSLYLGDGPLITRVVVGNVNDAIGGAIGGYPYYDQWYDMQQVAVTAKVLPTPIPLQQLTLCNPALQQAPTAYTGTGAITPSSPLRFEIPGLLPDQALVVIVRSSWTLNGNQSTAIVEFPGTAAELVGVSPAREGAPSQQTLAASPNPFVARTTARFTLPTATGVRLNVFDVNGARVRTLRNGETLGPGVHDAVWDGRDDTGRLMPTGFYFIVLDAGATKLTAKVVRVR